MNFNPSAVVDNLYYMGVGMLSILIVSGIIIVVTMLLNKITTRKKNKKQ